MSFSLVPDCIAEDGELVSEAKAQIAKLTGQPIHCLPPFAGQIIAYFLDGGNRPVPKNPKERHIASSAKIVLRELLAEYPLTVPQKVRARLK